MMIKCPKCGFSQPKDKYCAQCGLDIETYRPPKVPLSKKLMADPFFHLFLVLLIALGSGFYVYKSNRKEIQDRVSFFQHGVQYARESGTNTSRGSEPTEGGAPAEGTDDSNEMYSGNQTQALRSNELTPPPPPQNQNPNLNPPSATSTPTDTSSTRPPPEGRPQIQVQYVEVNTPVLEQIYADARQSGLFNSLGDHVAGIWPQARKKIVNLRGWKPLTKESKAIELGRPLHFFVGLKGNEPESDLGLTTYVEVAAVDAAGIHGHFEVVRTWREPNPDGTSSIQRRFYPAQIDIPPESFFFLAGVLPRGSPMENDPYLTNIDPFKILKTNFFKNRETEFLIVLDFDRQIQ